MKKTASILFTSMVSVFMMWVIYLNTPQPNEQKNGFTRKFFKIAATEKSSIYFPDNRILNMCGASSSGYYFQSTSPSILIYSDKKLQSLKSIQLDIECNDAMRSNFDISVDSPLVYLFTRNTGSFTRYDMSIDSGRTFQLSCYIYSRNVVLSDSEAVVRGFSKQDARHQCFIKDDFTHYSIKTKSFFREQDDAGLSTDGLLQFDETSHLLTYIFFYKNGIYCIDTNLQTAFVIPTIDTVHLLQTRFAGAISPDKSHIDYSNASPLIYTNLESSTSQGSLYLRSALIADNEALNDFTRNAVIDVYDLQLRRYAGSFYLPAYKGQIARRFKVCNNNIIAVYENYVVCFSLPDN